MTQVRASGVLIHRKLELNTLWNISHTKNKSANGDTDNCLAVGSGYAAAGTIVEMYAVFRMFGHNYRTNILISRRIQCFAFDDPEFGALQLWDITRDTAGQVKLNGTNFCLDGGNLNPA